MIPFVKAEDLPLTNYAPPTYRRALPNEEPIGYWFDEDEALADVQCLECTCPLEAPLQRKGSGLNRSRFCPGCRRFYDVRYVRQEWEQTGDGPLAGHYVWRLQIKKVEIKDEIFSKPQKAGPAVPPWNPEESSIKPDPDFRAMLQMLRAERDAQQQGRSC